MLKRFSLAYKGRFASPVNFIHSYDSAYSILLTKFLLASLLAFVLVSLIAFLFPVQSFAAISSTINVQSKIVNLTTGTNLAVGSPACVKSGADTCDFRIRVWNHITNSSTTSGSGNLLFTQTFQDVEIGDYNGIFTLTLNSCGSSLSGNSQWGTTTGTCTATDDSDSDSDLGVNFNRDDLYVEVSFAPADTSGSVGSFTEVFTRIAMTSFTSAYYANNASNLNGIPAESFVQISPSAIQTTGDVTTTLIAVDEDGSGTPDLLDLRVANSSKFFVNNAGQVAIGTGTVGSTWLTLSKSSTTSSQINFVSTSAVDPSAPAQGDLWYNGTSLNFYDGTRTVDLLPTNAQGFVKLQPTTVQGAAGSTTLIWLNSTAGAPNLLDLKVGGTSKLLVNNAGQLQLSTQGSSGGLLVGGDAKLYRSAANTLKTDNSFMVGANLSTSLTNWGVSDFTGNIRSVVTVANGSTTANGAGSSSTKLVVASTSNFDVGNLVLINSTTYAFIESVDSTTQLTISPATTWSNSNSVVEYTLPSLQFQKAYLLGGIVTGGGSGTSYSNKQISSPGALAITVAGAASILNLNSQSDLNINTSLGVTLTKNEQGNVTGSWSAGVGGGVARQEASAVVYNGKAYIWAGWTGANLLNSLDIFDLASQTWSTGTAGGTARANHSAVVYNDKMYAWGGCDIGGCSTRLNTIDIYDFKTNSWSTGTAGGTARYGHKAILYNGKMYAWGGNSGSAINTMDIYDIATDSWTTGTTGGTARYIFSGVLYNAKLYFWGGFNGTTNLNTVDIYDLVRNVWTTGAAGGTARNSHNGVVYRNKFYNWGGFSGGNLNTMDIYDFALNSWTTGVTGGTARSSYTTAVYSDKLYVWGGTTGSAVNSSDVFDFGYGDNVLTIKVADQEKLRLDSANVLTVSGEALGLKYATPDTKQYSTQGWTTGTTGGTARGGITAILYNGKMYIWGGTTGAAMLNTMDIFDLATNTWSTGATGGTAKAAYAATVYNGKIYFAQGCTNLACSTVVNSVDIYDIAGNSWSTGTSGGTARGQVAAVGYNGRLYITNGQNAAGTRQTIVDIYDIAANSWSTGTSGGTGRNVPAIAIHNNRVYIWGGMTAAPALLNTLDIYDMITGVWSTGTAGGTARSGAIGMVYNAKFYTFGGCTNTACTTPSNVADVYDIERNVWITGGATGGTARITAGGIIYSGKYYQWAGSNGAAVINTMDIYDFGVSKAEDVFYIANAQGVGPDDGKLFRFDATGRAYTSKQGGWFSVGADYAEYMYTNDTSLGAGELVSLDDSSSGSIKRSEAARDGRVIGVISTEPGFVGNIENIENLLNGNENWKLLSMVGQVPVKVNAENGKISIGDSITSSSTPGEGMKADPGDPTIGIAEENYTGEEPKSIKVLITRNNKGINNLVELKLGAANEAGFRVNAEGKLEYREASSKDWMPLANRISVDKAMLWQQVGDDVYNTSPGNTVLGLSDTNSATSKLSVAKDLEVTADGKFIKLSSEGLISIGGYGVNLGIRVNPATKELEYLDNGSGGWKNLNSSLTATTRVEIDKIIEENNQTQISGWGFIQGGASLKLDFPIKFNHAPIIITSAIGVSANQPKSLAECTLSAASYSVGSYQISNSAFNIETKLAQTATSDAYYCFSWIARGN